MVGGTALSSSKHKQEGERRQGKNLRILRTQFCCWLRKQRGKTRPASKRPHIDHWAFSSIHKTRGETAILSTKRGIVLLNSTELTGFIDRLEYLGRKSSGIILSIPGDVYGAVHAGNWRPKSCGIVRPDFRDGTGGKSPVYRLFHEGLIQLLDSTQMGRYQQSTCLPATFLFFTSMQSSSGTVTPDPEFFFDDLCFEAPCNLDTTSAQDAPPVLNARPHTAPTTAAKLPAALPPEQVMGLLNTHDDICCSIKSQEEQDRESVYRLYHRGLFLAGYSHRKRWCKTRSCWVTGWAQ